VVGGTLLISTLVKISETPSGLDGTPILFRGDVNLSKNGNIIFFKS